MEVRVTIRDSKILLESSDREVSHRLSNGLQAYLPAYPEARKQAEDSFLDLTIPDHPGAVSIELLRRRDVLTGQIFALADLLAPLVGSHDTPDLYPFQVEGIAWLTSGHRRLLADDMGLGKTVQAICAAGDLLRRGEIRFAWVVCPKTLVLTWISEFNRWDSKLAVTALLPGGRTAHSVWQHQLHRTHVVVTSYDQLREHHDTMVLQAQLLITDEAHRLRNLSSGVSKAIRALNPRYFWMLSGTPVERDNLDMASLLSILAPAQFTKKSAALHNSVLRANARPFIKRRSKNDVLTQLPPLTQVIERIPLSPEQASAYLGTGKMLSTNHLKRFAQLRQICDIDPVSGKSTKLDRIFDILSEIKGLNEKAVVFSYWKIPSEELYRRLMEVEQFKVNRLIATMDIIERNRQLEQFKMSGDILLASGKIGSEGLTLTEANHVIFINRWWNPSAHEQAQDRIRRIGQDRPTFSYSFIAPGTIEERISVMLASKSMTIAELVVAVETSL